MKTSLKKELNYRNNYIINLVKTQIEDKCPKYIDLIGISGSFCNGDIYEKSDLDLLIINNNEKAKYLDKCFILKDVAFDIYTQDWKEFEKYSLYQNPYVTKLIDLDIIYTSKEGIKHYKELQRKLKENMNNTILIDDNIKNIFSSILNDNKELQNETQLHKAYMLYVNILRNTEYIIYMKNKTYIKRGIKRIPEEILSMKILPNNFKDIYLKIPNISSIEEMQKNSYSLINSIQTIINYTSDMQNLDNKKSVIRKKKNLTKKDIIGTYEEIFSNWKNKMIHAQKTNNVYLSFVTMAACQEFYDEMYKQYNIEKIELIDKYNYNNLNKNVINFNKSMENWKKLYDILEIKINYYNNLSELSSLYEENSKQLKKI